MMKLGVEAVDLIIRGFGKAHDVLSGKKAWSYEVSPDVLGFIEENRESVKAIIVGAPHTAMADGYHGIRLLQKYPELQGLIKVPGKKALFEGKLGFFIGGIIKKYGIHPLNRSEGSGYLKNLIEKMNEKDESGNEQPYIWGVTPEGSRSRADDGWKYGFMKVMKELKIPLLLCGFDYQNRRFAIDKIIPYSVLEEGGEEKVWEALEAYFHKDMAKHPDRYNEEIRPKVK